mmetsp:Transcript_21292/g.59209  ORF Transcript_21292/g.59209 Transcript_21292/m.59209 type:complete len:242 (+) Transcript_21292:94-819(+)
MHNVIISQSLIDVSQHREIIIIEAHGTIQTIPKLRSEHERVAVTISTLATIGEYVKLGASRGDRSSEGVPGDPEEVVAIAVGCEALWTLTVRIIESLQVLLAPLLDIGHLALAAPRRIVVNGVHEVVANHFLGAVLDKVLSCHLIGEGSIMDAAGLGCCDDRKVVGMLDPGALLVLEGDRELFCLHHEYMVYPELASGLGDVSQLLSQLAQGREIAAFSCLSEPGGGNQSCDEALCDDVLE